VNIPLPGLILNGPSGPDTLTLEKYLGGGSFGVVYKAVESLTGTHYAVKFPQSAVFGGAAELSAFQNEVRAATEIVHTNVVRVFHVEVNPTATVPYLVMEFLDGGTLEEVLEAARVSNTQMDLSRVRDWGSGLLNGIAAINEKMLHRDLKPDNIMLDGDVPKIGDFGLSKVIGALTRSKTFKAIRPCCTWLLRDGLGRQTTYRSTCMQWGSFSSRSLRLNTRMMCPQSW
jgi:eukaryotic-like serine/threonine-protein kinase